MPAQTRTRLNCRKIGSVDLSAAERLPPVYPAGGRSLPLAVPTPQPCFKKSPGQGLYGIAFCLLHGYFRAYSFNSFSDRPLDLMPLDYFREGCRCQSRLSPAEPGAYSCESAKTTGTRQQFYPGRGGFYATVLLAPYRSITGDSFPLKLQ